jgi:exodeoxyribonuclease III
MKSGLWVTQYYIGPSVIVPGQLGGFGARRFSKGSPVSWFFGPDVRGTIAEIEEMQKTKDGAYMISLQAHRFIDGKDGASLAQFFNDRHRTGRNNLARVRGKSRLLETKRATEPGDEFTFDYGRSYWDFHKKHNLADLWQPATQTIPSVVAATYEDVVVLSQNLNGFRAATKKGLMSQLQDRRADIYCFQEPKTCDLEDKVQHKPLFRDTFARWADLGYNCLINECSLSNLKGHHGTYVFTLLAYEEYFTSFSLTEERDEWEQEGRVQIVVFAAFVLLNLYATQPGLEMENFDRRTEFLRRLKSCYRRLEVKYKRPIFVMGDMNVAPLNGDASPPERPGNREVERAQWNSAVEELELRDAFQHFGAKNVCGSQRVRELTPLTYAPTRYTWFFGGLNGFNRQNNRGMRLDHLWAPASAYVPEGAPPEYKRPAVTVKSFTHLQDTVGSDHLGIQATLRVPIGVNPEMPKVPPVAVAPVPQRELDAMAKTLRGKWARFNVEFIEEPKTSSTAKYQKPWMAPRLTGNKRFGYKIFGALRADGVANTVDIDRTRVARSCALNFHVKNANTTVRGEAIFMCRDLLAMTAGDAVEVAVTRFVPEKKRKSKNSVTYGKIRLTPVHNNDDDVMVRALFDVIQKLGLPTPTVGVPQEHRSPPVSSHGKEGEPDADEPDAGTDERKVDFEQQGTTSKAKEAAATAIEEEARYSEEYLSAAQAAAPNETPYITITVKGRETKALIDTGASHCIVGLEFLEQMGYDRESVKRKHGTDHGPRFKIADNTRVRAIALVPLDLTVRDTEGRDVHLRRSFWVLPTTSTPMILGIELWKEVGLSFDFDENTVSFPKINVVLPLLQMHVPDSKRVSNSHIVYAAHAFEIPANSERIVQGKIAQCDAETAVMFGDEGFVHQIEHKFNPVCIAAMSLARIKGRSTVVRLCNSTDQPTTIMSGTPIATIDMLGVSDGTTYDVLAIDLPTLDKLMEQRPTGTQIPIPPIVSGLQATATPESASTSQDHAISPRSLARAVVSEQMPNAVLKPTRDLQRPVRPDPQVQPNGAKESARKMDGSSSRSTPVEGNAASGVVTDIVGQCDPLLLRTNMNKEGIRKSGVVNCMVFAHDLQPPDHHRRPGRREDGGAVQPPPSSGFRLTTADCGQPRAATTTARPPGASKDETDDASSIHNTTHERDGCVMKAQGTRTTTNGPPGASKDETDIDASSTHNTTHERDGCVMNAPDPWTTSPMNSIDLTETQREVEKHAGVAGFQQVKDMLIANGRSAVYAPRPGLKDGESIRIETSGPPRAQHPNKASPAERAQIRSFTEKLVDGGQISPSNSPWAAGVIMVPKKDGTTRFCCDLRALNAVTVRDSYPVARTDQVLNDLAGVQWLSGVDLTSAFHQLTIHEDDREKTAFATPEGLFHWNVMPFGLKNATAQFTRFVHKVVGRMRFSCVVVYCDDIVCHSPSFEQHLVDVGNLLDRLNKWGVVLKTTKCFYFHRKLEFLGHTVSNEGIAPNENKVRAIVEMPMPATADQIRSFIGQAGYYRQYVKGFSAVCNPLLQLLKSKKSISKKGLPPDCKAAVNAIKTALTTEPILRHPNWDLPFEIHCDGSAVGLGATLVQRIPDPLRPGKTRECVVQYISRTTTDREKKYHQYLLECAALVWSIRIFRTFVAGAEFTVVTDNQAVSQLLRMGSQDIGRRKLASWILELQEYEFTIKHRAGKKHGDADGLSRLPVDTNYKGGDVERVNEYLDELEASTSNPFASMTANPVQAEEEEKGDVSAEGVQGYRSAFWKRVLKHDQTEAADLVKREAERKAQNPDINIFELDWDTFAAEQRKEPRILRDIEEWSVLHEMSDDEREDAFSRSDARLQANHEARDKQRKALRQWRQKQNLKAAANGEKPRPKVPGEKRDVRAFYKTFPTEVFSAQGPNVKRDAEEWVSLHKLSDEERERAFAESDTHMEHRRSQREALREWQDQRKLELRAEGEDPKPEVPGRERDVRVFYHAREVRVSKEHEHPILIDTTPCKGEYNNSRRRERIVTPASMTASVLRHFHGLPINGHLGRNRTYHNVAEHFVWRGIYRDVARWVKSCVLCQRRKPPRPLKVGMTRSMSATRPGQIWCIDHVGPFPPTAEGYEYILTMHDQFTRWCIAVPVKRRTAGIVFKHVMHEIVFKYGPPEILFSDREPGFAARAMKEMCRQFGIKKAETTGYQPQANSSLERFHSFMAQALTMLVDKHKEDWNEWLETVMWTYRISVNATTGFSPFFLMHGREPRQPMIAQLGIGDSTQYQDQEYYGLKTSRALQEAYATTRVRQAAAQERAKQRRDGLTEEGERKSGSRIDATDLLPPGTMAMFWEPEKRHKKDWDRGDDKQVEPKEAKIPKKLEYRYSGPWRVHKACGCKLHRWIIHEARGKLIKVNVNRLREFTPWDNEHLYSNSNEEVLRAGNEHEDDAEEAEDWVGSHYHDEGELVIVPYQMESGDDQPFEVGKILQRRPNHEFGHLVQWFGNNKMDVHGKWKLGWLQANKKKRGDVKHYFRPARTHTSHLPYTNETTSTVVTDANTLPIRPFELTDKHEIPLGLLKELSAREDVGFSFDPNDEGWKL